MFYNTYSLNHPHRLICTVKKRGRYLKVNNEYILRWTIEWSLFIHHQYLDFYSSDWWGWVVTTMEVVLLAVLFVVSLVYLFVTYNNNYWKRRGIPQVTPLPFVGNSLDLLLLKKCMGLVHADIYRYNTSYISHTCNQGSVFSYLQWTHQRYWLFTHHLNKKKPF